MKAPVGLLSDRTVLRQQDGGAPPRQVPRLRAQRSNESPSGAFKRQNGPAQQPSQSKPDGFASSPEEGGAYKCFRSNTKKLPLSGELARSKATRLRGSSSYMFFLDKHPAGVLSLQHRDRIPADGTLWSTTVQGCGDVNADRLGSLAQLLRKAALFAYQGGCLYEDRY